MTPENKATGLQARKFALRGLELVEDFVYITLGLLLTAVVGALLWEGFKSAAQAVISKTPSEQIPAFLGQVLLILLVTELLYTVQVSFRERGLLAEPFLVVALIAVVRRILVITAELPKLPQQGEQAFHDAIVEMSLLTVMILALVGALLMLRKRAQETRVK